MVLVLALILVPLIAGAAMLAVRSNALRTGLLAAVVIPVGIGSIVLTAMNTPFDSAGFNLTAPLLKWLMFAAEILMGLYMAYVGVRFKRPLIALLALAQMGMLLWMEAIGGGAEDPAKILFIDKLAVVMGLINGAIGGGICLYALSYMKEYHQTMHKEVPDRRPMFFSTMLVFMGAMFGLVFSNNLQWLQFFWEITTLCSFLLIGYTQTPQARKNALLALVMNLLGGLAFSLAIFWLHRSGGPADLQSLLASGKVAVLLPAALLAFAGITKSAQLPFSSWLLGAMVAPTPVSALLHSSTMVKAGVYLVLRLAPVLRGNQIGLIVALVGAVTFVVGSLAATTQSDAKRVLAWSTIANLGLIVLCGGIGSAEAIWAGVLLIIFHALAKCLLFLCVGIVEQKTHSRDIDAMSGLVVRMPRIAVMMLIGMAGMFLAPFGMLISKWAVLKAVIDAYPLLSAFIAFGGAATLFFWVKWMGKLVEVVGKPETLRPELTWGQGAVLYGMAAATFATCLLFPLISWALVEPYLRELHLTSELLSRGNMILVMIMMGLILLFPLSFIFYGKGGTICEPYLGGANANGGAAFVGSAGVLTEASTGGYYLRGILNERWVERCGEFACIALLAIMMVLAAAL